MRVLILSHHFYPNWGGTESYVSTLAKYLNRDHYPTAVYSYGWSSPSNTEYRIYRNVIQPSAACPQYLKPFLLGFQQVTDIFKLQIIKKDIDLLHVQGLTRGFEFYINPVRSLSLLQGWTFLKGIPKVITFHEAITERNVDSYLKEARHCDSVICVNEKSAALIKSKVANARVHFVPNGVDIELFDPKKFKRKQNQCFTVLCPSRTTKQKGILELINAAQIIVHERGIKDIQFFLMGEGYFSPGYRDLSFYQYVQNRLDKLGLNEYFKFKQGRPFYKMPDLYASCDIVVLPSHDEGFSLVVLEAMAMEKPVVATPVGETLRLITDGKEGFIVQKGESVSLAEAILDLYQSISLRKQMGDCGRKKVEDQFECGKTSREVERVYESVSKR